MLFVDGLPEVRGFAQYAGLVVFLVGFLVVFSESEKLEHSEVDTVERCCGFISMAENMAIHLWVSGWSSKAMHSLVVLVGVCSFLFLEFFVVLCLVGPHFVIGIEIGH